MKTQNKEKIRQKNKHNNYSVVDISSFPVFKIITIHLDKALFTHNVTMSLDIQFLHCVNCDHYDTVNMFTINTMFNFDGDFDGRHYVRTDFNI